MGALILIVMLPITLLNAFGSIGAAIWLAFLGEWTTLGIGIALMIASTFLIGIALIPQAALALPAIRCFEKGFTVGGYFLGALAAFYLYGLISTWCGGVLWFFEGSISNRSATLPTLLWSYAVATGPWAWLASREARAGGDATATNLTTFFVCLGYLVMILTIILGGATIEQAMRIFVTIMSIALLLNVLYSATVWRSSTA